MLKHPWPTMEIGTPYYPGVEYDTLTGGHIAESGRKWARRHGKDWVIKARTVLVPDKSYAMGLRPTIAIIRVK